MAVAGDGLVSQLNYDSIVGKLPKAKGSSSAAKGKSEADPGCKTSGERPDDETIARNAKIRAGLQAAITVINTLTAYKIAELQYKLGKDYARLAEDYRNYYNENYKPLEKELVAEVMKNEKFVRDKDDFYKGQMLISAKLPFIGKLEQSVSCTGRYCTGQRQSIINDLTMKQAMTESLVCGAAYRYAVEEKDTRDKVRWERRDNVLKIGRDLPAEGVSYAGMASGIYGSIGKQASDGAVGAMKYLIYSENRNETIYPPRRGPLTLGGIQVTKTDVQSPMPHYRDYQKPQVVVITGGEVKETSENVDIIQG